MTPRTASSATVGRRRRNRRQSRLIMSLGKSGDRMIPIPMLTHGEVERILAVRRLALTPRQQQRALLERMGWRRGRRESGWLEIAGDYYILLVLP